MYYYSERSKNQLATCDKRLQDIFNEVIKIMDVTIIEGHRGKNKQNKAYKEGKSQVKYPNGKHNKLPSLAVDAVPCPSGYEKREPFFKLAGLVIGIGEMKGVKIRWGGEFKDKYGNEWFDGAHFEIVED